MKYKYLNTHNYYLQDQICCFQTMGAVLSQSFLLQQMNFLYEHETWLLDTACGKHLWYDHELSHSSTSYLLSITNN